jgi:hypothetical protein
LSLTIQGEKIEAIEFYFKFKKVIFIKLKNDAYKNKLIKTFSRSDENLSIEYVKGYKSPKWKEHVMWEHIIKRNYSEEKKSANTEFFEAFFVQGIKNMVLGVEEEIKEKLYR